MMLPSCFQADTIALSILIFLTLPDDPYAFGDVKRPERLCSPPGTPCVPGFPCEKSGRIFTGLDFKEQIPSCPSGRTLVLGPAHFQAGFQQGRIGDRMAAAQMTELELPAIFCCDQTDL